MPGKTYPRRIAVGIVLVLSSPVWVPGMAIFFMLLNMKWAFDVILGDCRKSWWQYMKTESVL